jgi:2-isopropylmalate synthase
MHPEVGNHVGAIADKLGKELSPEAILAEFRAGFVNLKSPLELRAFDSDPIGKDRVLIRAEIIWKGDRSTLKGEGNGPISAFVHALLAQGWTEFTLSDYRSHALASGEESSAAAYVSIQSPDGRMIWGCGEDPNIELAGLKALVSAVNRLQA